MLAASLERAVTDSAELLLAAGAVLAIAYGLTRARIGVFQWPLLGASVLALGMGAVLGGWAWHEKQPRTVVGSPTEEFSNTLREQPNQYGQHFLTMVYGFFHREPHKLEHSNQVASKNRLLHAP